jgi:colanic acid biosynthesis glycosyl transferase WcaI
LKIAFVLGLPNPFPGAAWIRVSLLGDVWDKHCYPVDVLGVFTCRSFKKHGKSKFSNLRIFNFAFHVDDHNPLAFIFNSVNFFICLTFYLLCRKPNVVAISVPSGDVGLGAMIACKMLKIKYVIDYRDEWEDLAINLSSDGIERLFYSIVRRVAVYLYSSSIYVVSVTPNISTVLAKRGILKTEFMPNGADIETFRPLFNKPKCKQFKLFYSGGVGGYYRLDVVAKAIRLLIDSGLTEVKLIVAGSGDVSELLILADKLGIKKNIEYNGAITDRQELAKKLAEADLGLVPYDNNPLWKNSLPAKFFEYCACGLPVIATVYEDSLLGKLIRDNAIGIISPPLDVVKLAEAIYNLYCNNSYREAAGENARILIEEYLELIKDY